MHRLLLLVAGTVLFGCGGDLGPRYDSASRPFDASYDLVANGASFGSAHVVAADAEQEVIDGEDRVVLPVAVLIDNATNEDVAIGTRFVQIAYVETQDGSRVDGDSIEILKRAATKVDEGVARVEARFALPPGYSVNDVAGFGVRWSVERSGENFTETTSFKLPSPGSTPVVVLNGPQSGGYEEFYNGLTNHPYRAEPVRPPVSSEKIPAQGAQAPHGH